MSTDARRDRVADAIWKTMAAHNHGCDFSQQIADAAIVAYENEPEPIPQLLDDMAQAVYTSTMDASSDPSQALARVALGVVVKRLRWCGYSPEAIVRVLGIPESMVREMLDE